MTALAALMETTTISANAVDEFILSLRGDGFTSFQISSGKKRVRIGAFGKGMRREVVIDPKSGKVLSE